MAHPERIRPTLPRSLGDWLRLDIEFWDMQGKVG